MLTIIAIVVIALAFDYINGFHDAANSIATAVSKLELTPRQAVVWAAFWAYWIVGAFSTERGRVAWSREVGIRVVIAAIVVVSVVVAAWIFLRRRRAEVRTGGGTPARQAEAAADRRP